MRPWFRALALLAGLTAVLRGAPLPVDLDVGIPPGSPLEWTSVLPAYTPPRSPLFPRTGSPEERADPERSSSKLATSEVDVRIASSFGQVRVLTWDLAAHLEWIQKTVPLPRTGRSGLRPGEPEVGDPLYWLALAPLLRLLLHPNALARSEVLAHLVELGESTLPVLGSASGERGLATACRELRALIRVDTGPTPSAPRGDTPRAGAFARFVLEECLRDEPMDPTDDFGRRMFLFAEEAEPLLRAYAEHPSLTLARNATVAVGRYETRASASFLAALAARVEDPVTLTRALAALSRYRGPLETGPLVERLKKTTEPVTRAALAGALGRLGARDAAPVLVELGASALEEQDPDLLLTVLSALAHIAWTRTQPEIAAFCELVEAHTRKGDWKVPRAMEGDIPDAPDLRETMLRQLALLARSQVAPLDDEIRAGILAMAESKPLDPRLTESGQGGKDPLGNLGPPVRFLYLEALLRCGAQGLEQLAMLARSAQLDTGLRARALALLPYDQRIALAKDWLEDPLVPAELRVQALEVLIADQAPELVLLCRSQLERPVLKEPLPPAGEMFLTLRAVRYLSETGKLHAKELLPLYPFVQRPLVQRAHQIEELSGTLTALVEAARAREPGRRLRELAGIAFGYALESRLNDQLTASDHDAMVDSLVALATPPRRDKDPDEPVANVVQRMRAVLLASEFLVPPDPQRNLFQPQVPLAEEVLLALGRTHEPAALELLLTCLTSGARELRAHAALALGMCGVASVAQELLPALLDEDGFVRFCASESLRHLVEKEIAVDWMYAPAEERRAAAEEFRRWFLEEKR